MVGPATRGAGRQVPTSANTADVVEVVERFMIRPLGWTLLRSVRIAQRLQNGRLDAYLAYMLLAVIAVLAVVAALS